MVSLYLDVIFETVKCHVSPNKTDETVLCVTEKLLLKRMLNTDFIKILRD